MTADANVFATQVTLGMIGAGFLQMLKKSTVVAWVNSHSKWINHAVLLATSAAGALSVHFVWNGSAHSLTITGLDLATIAASAWLWGKQWTIQYLVHRGAFGAIAQPEAPPVAPAVPMALGAGVAKA